jgi:hypothetical protein
MTDEREHNLTMQHSDLYHLTPAHRAVPDPLGRSFPENG